MNKNFKHLVSASAVVAFLFIASGSGEDKKGSSSAPTQINTDNKVTYKKVGETLPTEYFDVTINKISVENSVNTGNEFANLRAEAGIRYLIINTTFKNTSNESRAIFDGEVYINYNGKDYTFDKSESVMAEGWGLMLDQINPLTSKTTKLVYKLPAEIKGVAYYKPGRSGSNDLIELGEIK